MPDQTIKCPKQFNDNSLALSIAKEAYTKAFPQGKNKNPLQFSGLTTPPTDIRLRSVQGLRG